MNWPALQLHTADPLKSYLTHGMVPGFIIDVTTMSGQSTDWKVVNHAV